MRDLESEWWVTLVNWMIVIHDSRVDVDHLLLAAQRQQGGVQEAKASQPDADQVVTNFGVVEQLEQRFLTHLR